MCKGYWSRTRTRVAVRLARGLVLVLLQGIPLVWAEKPPVRHYDVRDGLAHSRVNAIY